MTFQSILDIQVSDHYQETPPVFFGDLNIDQVINSVVAGREEYNLKPYFYCSLNDPNTIFYRQQVMRDIENTDLLQYLTGFSDSMRSVRTSLKQIATLYYKHQKDRLYLDVVKLYLNTISELSLTMQHLNLKSEGLSAFRNYIGSYIKSKLFLDIVADIQNIENEMSSINYSIYINGLRVQVKHCFDDSEDYSEEIASVFSRFREGAVKSYLIKLPHTDMMNDVEARILDCVAKLHPDYFQHLEQFVQQNADFQDSVISLFDREIQFYLSWLEFVQKFTSVGLNYCYPEISILSKQINAQSTYDMALADKLINEQVTVVTNDFRLDEKERIFVVSGPNQGGKTTFARVFGQLHYFATLGCPVAGSSATLFLYDKIFTHFEKEENMKSMRGRLQDELFRIHSILQEATGNSLIIINEIFTSTTLQDQLQLSFKIMHKLCDLDIIGVWVTFIDELSAFSEKTVSVLSSVSAEDVYRRTYKIIRKQADGLAYAFSLVEKYRLTYSLLTKRLTYES